MDFTYQNITFDMKQLVEVLRCDLQVTINEGLIETQMELLNNRRFCGPFPVRDDNSVSPTNACSPRPPVDQMWWQPSTARCHLER